MAKKKIIALAAETEAPIRDSLVQTIGEHGEAVSESITDSVLASLDEKFADADSFVIAVASDMSTLAEITTTKPVLLVCGEEHSYLDVLARLKAAKLTANYSFYSRKSNSIAAETGFMQQYFEPDTSPGLAALTQKGDQIIFEKIQSTSDLGIVADALSANAQIKHKQFAGKSFLIQNIINAVVSQAYQLTAAVKDGPKTCATQILYSQELFAVSARFGSKDTNPQKLREEILHGKNRYLNAAWTSADHLQVSLYPASEEIEVKCILMAKDAKNPEAFNSLLVNETAAEANVPSLETVPEGVTYLPLNDIVEAYYDSIMNIPSPTSLGKQFLKPEDRQTQLQKSIQKYQEVKQKGVDMAAAQGAKNAASDALKSKGNAQALEKQLNDANAEIARLNKALDLARNSASDAVEQAKSTGDAAAERDALRKERELLKQRIAEAETKQKAAEEATLEKRKQMHEKDKEITDLKKQISELQASIKKLGKKQGDTVIAANPGAAGGGGAAGGDELKKLRSRVYEMEENEKKLTLAIKQSQFKLDNADKAVEAAKKEAEEKTKLLEKKLDFEKGKSEDLQKRVTELTEALKQAKKAA